LNFILFPFYFHFIFWICTGSPWRDKLSLAILELQEKGTIQLLYNKWWKNTGDVCNEKKDSKAASPLADNIGGVFVVLFAGLLLALIVAICEFCCHVKKNASTREVRFPPLHFSRNLLKK